MLHQEALYFQVPLDLTHIIKKMQRESILLRGTDGNCTCWVHEHGKQCGGWTQLYKKNIPKEWGIGPLNDQFYYYVDQVVLKLIKEGGYKVTHTTTDSSTVRYLLEPLVPEKMLVMGRKK